MFIPNRRIKKKPDSLREKVRQRAIQEEATNETENGETQILKLVSVRRLGYRWVRLGICWGAQEMRIPSRGRFIVPRTGVNCDDTAPFTGGLRKKS